MKIKNWMMDMEFHANQILESGRHITFEELINHVGSRMENIDLPYLRKLYNEFRIGESVDAYFCRHNSDTITGYNE